MTVCDIHTHILPGLDDGAADVQTSEKMIAQMKAQGVTDVCLTPHYYPQYMMLKHFLQKRDTAIRQVSELFERAGINLHPASEVRLSQKLFFNESLSALCIDGGSYLLLELPFEPVSTSEIEKSINMLSANYSVTPIIVHPERQKYIFNLTALSEFAAMGCLVQFDSGSLKSFFTRRKLIQYIDADLIQLVGSDCHDSKKRLPDMIVIEKYLDAPTSAKLLENNARMIR